MIAGGDDKKIAVFGEIEVEAWYKSHYPLEFLKHKRVYICEFCLGYFKSETLYKRHMVITYHLTFSLACPYFNSLQYQFPLKTLRIFSVVGIKS